MKRQQQLLQEWGEKWVRPIRRLIWIWDFHRGFVEDVSMWTDTFIAHAARLFRHAPIRHLCLWSHYTHDVQHRFNIAAMSENYYLRRLRSLALHHQLNNRSVRSLLVSEHLTALTELDLSSNRIGDNGVRALAASPLLGQLKYLNLCGNDIGAKGLRALEESLEALACSPEGLRLQCLELTYNNLRDAGRRIIDNSPLLQRLLRI